MDDAARGARTVSRPTRCGRPRAGAARTPGPGRARGERLAADASGQDVAAELLDALPELVPPDDEDDPADDDEDDDALDVEAAGAVDVFPPDRESVR